MAEAPAESGAGGVPGFERIVVVAPNWLGDAVMALPAIGDVRRAHPAARLAVAARGPVAGLFRLVSDVDEVIALRSDARWWRRGAFAADAAALAGFDAALLLPNSFHSAWLAKRAGIPERWGYAADLRARMLTRALPRLKGVHQIRYYQRLTSALGAPAGPLAPALDVRDEVRAAARALLEAQGIRRGAPLVVLAPGAAYGRAKQWPPRHVAELIARLTAGHALSCVVVGSRADAGTARAIRRALPAPDATVDLVGRTSLEELAGVLAEADVCVSNDSGAMHLAAAVGTSVVATFGPTDETATAPLAREGRTVQVLTHAVWCRPCMLRECPIDHRCMTGLLPSRVEAAVRAALPS